MRPNSVFLHLVSLLVLSAILSTDLPADDVSDWWAFQPLQRPAVPQLPGRAGRQVRTPVDAFLLQRLARRQARFSPIATRQTRLRSACINLVGLPPTEDLLQTMPGELQPAAWSRLLDRLLANPHYGEAWGRDWLDLVRYAETDGFKSDAERPQAYRYRDYVIRAYNEDRSYARFIQEQLAGDELFPEDREAIVATGFNRMWPDESNASNVELARQDALNDLTANVGNVFLGLSIGCAQCHDHKFDPILQTDFYRLQAYFAGIILTGEVPLGSPEQLRVYQDRLSDWLAGSRPVREELRKLEAPARSRAFLEKRRKFSRSVLDAVDTAIEDRSARQHQLAFWSERQLPIDEKQLLTQFNSDQKSRRTELKARLKELEKTRPQPPARMTAMATLEIPTGPPPTFLLDGGNYKQPLEEVQPGPPGLLEDVTHTPSSVASRRPGSSGRRAALAGWLTSADNPLVARVMVNRIWQGHFGVGLVANANDFGKQTAPPSHPELLDWLAAEFVASGWSIKHMHRVIMNSWAYQQMGWTSDTRLRQAGTIPPSYSYFPRRRLSSERIRDALLFVADRLDSRMYGKPVRPALPPKFGTRYTWDESKSAADRSRRSVYIHAKRNLPYPLLKVFDQPDMHESCARRDRTTVAPQALMLFNSELVLGFARALAERARRESQSTNPASTARRAWWLALGREPATGELQDAVTFLAEQGRLDPRSSTTALVDLCHVLINTNEFLYVD